VELSRAEHAEPSAARARIDVAAGALVGSRCTACETRSWPARAICSACGSDRLEAARLPRTGRLLSFTRVWVPRAGLPSPYLLGQVDLGRGATVFAHVRDVADATTVPAPVEVVLSPDPGAVPRFWFVPAGAETSA
jgi:uncharacterized OB-fold protein